MSWGIFASAGSSILGNMFGNSGVRKANQRLTNWYNTARQETTAEKELRLKLEKESKTGDPELHQKRMEVYRPIFSQSKSAKADATGVAIRQGLENSIIASEMKSKIDASTYQRNDEQADKILAWNIAYKKDAEDKLTNYKLQRDARLRSLAMQYQSGLQDTTSMGDSLLSAGASMLGSYASSHMPWSTSSQPIYNINLGTYPGQEEDGG